MVRLAGLEPARLPTRPSNVRVCLFRHSRMYELSEQLEGEIPKHFCRISQRRLVLYRAHKQMSTVFSIFLRKICAEIFLK